MIDPIKTYYELGYKDGKDGKKRRRVPHNFKLAYANGKYDAVAGRPNRYD